MDRSTARSLIYNMLSLFYVYPQEKIYTTITAGKWMSGFREVFHLLDEKIFDNYYRAIEQIISGLKGTEPLVMAMEYTLLFINASPNVIAPPYGAVYLEKKGVVSGEVISELLDFYNKMGFTLKEDLHDFPDHIVHELEFMGFLAGKESQASGNEKIKLEEIQMNFLSRFILPWILIFCANVVENSRHPFYYYLSKVTKEFINFEKNYLGVPEELNF